MTTDNNMEQEDTFEEAAPATKAETNDIMKQFLRAENEDDDGYDPYSDRPVYEPLFERDPWD